MTDTVRFTQIFDQRDAEILNELIVRMATRMHHFADARLHPMLANPMAIQMLTGYLTGALVTVCSQSGVDISQAPTVDGTGMDTYLSLIPRQ